MTTLKLSSDNLLASFPGWREPGNEANLLWPKNVTINELEPGGGGEELWNKINVWWGNGGMVHVCIGRRVGQN